jgi:hypothetical protein
MVLRPLQRHSGCGKTRPEGNTALLFLFRSSFSEFAATPLPIITLSLMLRAFRTAEALARAFDVEKVATF